MCTFRPDGLTAVISPAFTPESLFVTVDYLLLNINHADKVLIYIYIQYGVCVVVIQLIYAATVFISTSIASVCDAIIPEPRT